MLGELGVGQSMERPGILGIFNLNEPKSNLVPFELRVKLDLVRACSVLTRS